MVEQQCVVKVFEQNRIIIKVKVFLESVAFLHKKKLLFNLVLWILDFCVH